MERTSIQWGSIISIGLFVAFMAWAFWPRPEPVEPRDAVAAEPRKMRSLGTLRLSAGDSVEAMAIPNPDGYSSTVCVLYRGSAGTQFQCPKADALGD